MQVNTSKRISFYSQGPRQAARVLFILLKSLKIFFILHCLFSLKAEATECVIANKATGMMLDHYYGKSIQAYNNDEDHPHHRWIIKPKQDNTYAILNKATGKALDHYYGKSIQAYNNDEDHPHHRWHLNLKGDGSCAIANFATGKALDHYYGKSIQAYNNDEDHFHHRWFIIGTKFVDKCVTTDGSNPTDHVPPNQYFETFREAYEKVKIDARIHSRRLAEYHSLRQGFYPVEIYRSSNNGAIVAITLHPPHKGSGDENTLWHYHAKKVQILDSPSPEQTQQPNVIFIQSLNSFAEVSRTASFENCSRHYFINSSRGHNPRAPHSPVPPDSIFTVEKIIEIARIAGIAAVASLTTAGLSAGADSGIVKEVGKLFIETEAEGEIAATLMEVLALLL
ncbi:MAG: RICIN domain-containing protein [Bacteroidota bacterium]